MKKVKRGTDFDVVEKVGSLRHVNRAAKQGESDFILFLDKNAKVSKAALDKAAGIVNAASTKVAAFELRESPLEQTKYYDPASGLTQWMDSAGIIVRRSAFLKLHGFDPHLLKAGTTVDLSWALRSLGYDLQYLYEVPVEVKAHPKADQIHALTSNLYLRCKYGTLRNALKGHAIILKTFLKDSSVQRVKLLAAYLSQIFPRLLARIHRHLHSKTASKNSFTPCFYEKTGYGIKKIGEGFKIPNIKTNKKVSIIIRQTVNQPDLLREAKTSAENQSYKNLEIIVTENVNRALKQATGDYLLFLNDSDLLYPDHVETLLKTAEETGTKIVYSDSFEMGIKRLSSKPYRYDVKYVTHYESPSYSKNHLLDQNFFLRQPVLFHKDVLKKAKVFNEALGDLADWDFYLGLAKQGFDFHYIPHTTAIHRVPSARKKMRIFKDYATEIYDLIHTNNIETTVEKITKFNQALKEGKKTVLTFFSINDAIFRYRAYNTSLATKNSKKWLNLFFSFDELQQVKSLIPKANLVVIVRTEISDDVKNVVKTAKKFKIPVVMDIDDRICHVDYLPPAYNTVSNSYERSVLKKLAINYQKTAELVDGFITTNDFLGGELQKTFNKPYRVIPNSLNDTQIEFSQLYEWAAEKDESKYIIGYFSGSPSHNRDFLEAAPEIAKFMHTYPDTILRIVGKLGLPDYFREFEENGRVEYIPGTNYLRLQGYIANVDVNIAPLLIDEFTNSKSELKFFEAAVVSVPTIASPSYTFKNAIHRWQTGFLCKPGEWYETIEKLRNVELRTKIATAAKKYCLKQYTPSTILPAIESAYDFFGKK